MKNLSLNKLHRETLLNRISVFYQVKQTRAKAIAKGGR